MPCFYKEGIRRATPFLIGPGSLGSTGQELTLLSLNKTAKHEKSVNDSQNRRTAEQPASSGKAGAAPEPGLLGAASGVSALLSSLPLPRIICLGRRGSGERGETERVVGAEEAQGPLPCPLTKTARTGRDHSSLGSCGAELRMGVAWLANTCPVQSASDILWAEID